MARCVTLALAIVGSLSAASAQAQEDTSRLSFRWNAPNECPDDARALAAVVGFLGQPLAEAREQELVVSVNVQAVAAGFAAKLVFVSPQGAEERDLEHPDCEKLMEAAALLAALAIDPERVRARRAAAEAVQGAPVAEVPAPVTPPQNTPEPATKKECPPRLPARQPQPRPAWRPGFGMAALAGAGVLPGLRPGLTTELGVGVEGFHARLVGRYWFPGSADIQGGPLSIELSLATLGLHACAVSRQNDWSILTCFGANFGDMSGSGQGLNHAHTKHAAFGALETGVLTAYSRVQPAPFAGLGFSLAMVRPRFGASLAGVETETFKASQAAVLGYLGMSFGL
jgi:hypothetical protein